MIRCTFTRHVRVIRYIYIQRKGQETCFKRIFLEVHATSTFVQVYVQYTEMYRHVSHQTKQ